MSRATFTATLALAAMVALAALLLVAAALHRTDAGISLGCPACRSAA
jgi:hypothetical protein